MNKFILAIVISIMLFLCYNIGYNNADKNANDKCLIEVIKLYDIMKTQCEYHE